MHYLNPVPQIIWRVETPNYMAECWEAAGLKQIKGWFIAYNFRAPAIGDVFTLDNFVPGVCGMAGAMAVEPVSLRQSKITFASQGEMSYAAAVS